MFTMISFVWWWLRARLSILLQRERYFTQCNVQAFRAQSNDCEPCSHKSVAPGRALQPYCMFQTFSTIIVWPSSPYISPALSSRLLLLLLSPATKTVHNMFQLFVFFFFAYVAALSVAIDSRLTRFEHIISRLSYDQGEFLWSSSYSSVRRFCSLGHTREKYFHCRIEAQFRMYVLRQPTARCKSFCSVTPSSEHCLKYEWRYSCMAFLSRGIVSGARFPGLQHNDRGPLGAGLVDSYYHITLRNSIPQPKKQLKEKRQMYQINYPMVYE